MVEKLTTMIELSNDSSFPPMRTETRTVQGETTSTTIALGDLSYGDTHIRIKHAHEDTGTTDWSDTVRINLKPQPYILGVCLDNSNPDVKGSFFWIDAAGQKIDGAVDTDTYSTYKQTEIVTVDIDRDPVTMLKIPKFYIKTAASGPIGSFSEGKKCWWISDYQYPGFRVPGAFKRSIGSDGKVSVCDALYLGVYMADKKDLGSNTVFGSSKGVLTYKSTGQTLVDDILTIAQDRNDDSHSGFSICDMWDHGVLKLLLLIKNKSFNIADWCENYKQFSTVYPNWDPFVTGELPKRMPLHGTKDNPITYIDDAFTYGQYISTLTRGSDNVLQFPIYHPALWESDDSYITHRPIITAVPVSKKAGMGMSSDGVFRDVDTRPIMIDSVEHDTMELFIPIDMVHPYYAPTASFDTYVRVYDRLGENSYGEGPIHDQYVLRDFVGGSQFVADSYSSIELSNMWYCNTHGHLGVRLTKY